MELEITWGRVLKVWWAYFWRNLVAIAGVVVVGTVLGFVLGMVLGASGVSEGVIARAGTVLGAGIGLAASLIPVRLILGKDFGEFRLVLLAPAARQAGAGDSFGGQ